MSALCLALLSVGCLSENQSADPVDEWATLTGTNGCDTTKDLASCEGMTDGGAPDAR